MPVFSEFLGLTRFALGLRPFLAETIAPDEARRLVRHWVEERDARFLKKLERTVFRYRPSPYLALLRHAGCEAGDVAAMVRSSGIEQALAVLAKAGVYVTWEELKGRAPAVRGSRTFHFGEADFGNPLVTSHYRTSSGGTSGVPVRMHIDLEEHRQSAPDWAVLFAAHGWMDRPLVFWTPTHTGLANRYLKCAKFGKPYARWFAITDVATPQDRLRSALVHGLARWAAALSRPELVPVDRPGRICDYLLEALRDGLAPVVNTSPSAAARLSLEIQRRGESLEGIAFLLGAEPLTAARRRTIEQCGARAVPTYGTSECGWIGAQFPGARSADEVHLFRDAYAVCQGRDPGGDDGVARPLLFTNLRPASSKILLNAEIGDSAVVETDADSQPARELGYDVRLHTIRSFRKITAWGATFAQAELETVLEDALPKRFGGSVADYQLVEGQDERGLARLILRASPALGAISEEDLRATFLAEVNRLRRYYGFMTRVLTDADALRIERQAPLITRRGKLLPVITERSP